MLAPDTVLQNRYRVVRQLGQGGMGTVYEAIDLRFTSPVALKETHFTDEALRKQFEREAHLLYRLRHPAMARVIDHFTEGDGQYLVMDFIEGDDLWKKLEQLKGGAFPVEEVLKWADQLLDALDYLHTQDPPIIHRDIKPQNLKLTLRNQIILLDFGLAKGFGGQISRVTTSGSIFGYTPNYAPLEQIQGTGTDARSDLYALAATLYHLMTGISPPDVLSRLTEISNNRSDPLRPAHEANPKVPVAISHILQKAMAIGSTQRFARASAMRKALQHASQQGESVASQTTSAQPTRIDRLPTKIVGTESAPKETPRQTPKPHSPPSDSILLDEEAVITQLSPAETKEPPPPPQHRPPAAAPPQQMSGSIAQPASDPNRVPFLIEQKRSSKSRWWVGGLVALLLIGIVTYAIIIYRSDSMSDFEKEKPAIDLMVYGKFRDAEDWYREALSSEPNKALWHIRLGDILRRRSRDNEERGRFKKDGDILRLQSSDGEAQAKFKEAERLSREALRVNPGDAMAHYTLGLVLIEQQKKAEAEAEFRAALRTNPKEAEFYIVLADSLLRQSKRPEAETASRQAIQLRPGEARYHSFLSRILFVQSKYAEAESEARRAIQLEPRTSRFRIEFGYTLGFQEKFVEAEISFREAVRLDPDSDHSHGALAYALLGQKKFAEAESEYIKASVLKPTEALYYIGLGDALEGQGKYNEAGLYYREAISLKPDEALYHEALARVLERQGRKAEAKAARQEAERRKQSR